MFSWIIGSSLKFRFLVLGAAVALETLHAHARNLSERIIPRGVETDEVVEIVLLLRDVLAQSLFAKYQGYYNGSKSERSDHRKLDWHPNLAQLGKAAGTLALLLVLGAAPSAAWAFDRDGFKARAEATLAELNTKRLANSKATLARLDEMLALGIVGLKEYAASHPKYAKLMDAAIADSQAMKRMTDVEIEEKWGENGTAGDALGIPLKSLADFGEERAYLELVVGPAHQYIFVKKWESTKKARWLEQARDEAVELLKHLEAVRSK